MIFQLSRRPGRPTSQRMVKVGVSRRQHSLPSALYSTAQGYAEARPTGSAQEEFGTISTSLRVTTLAARAALSLLVAVPLAAVIGMRQTAMAVTRPATVSLNIKAQPMDENPPFPACRISGGIKTWATRSLKAKDMDVHQSNISEKLEVELAQFENGTHLTSCLPAGPKQKMDLSGLFVNVLVADYRRFNDGKFDRHEAALTAFRLASYHEQLADQYGEVPPVRITNIPKLGAFWGSESYHFTIVLIKHVVKDAVVYDGIVYRETVSTKFADELREDQMRESALEWSSIPQASRAIGADRNRGRSLRSWNPLAP
jgi:hypothetical protein